MAATPSYALRGPVGVVIAHPDDESMFFAPTLTTLERRGQRAAVLCLSSGDFYGLGQTRKRELVKACGVLGVEEDDVVIIEHPKLQDGSTEAWPADVVSSHVHDFVQKFGIQTILTFDEGGISGHSDHTAVNRGVALFLRTRAVTRHTASIAGGSGSSSISALDAFALVTTGMLRKYSGMLDMPWSLATSYRPPLGAFFSSCSARIAWAAMAAHHSQFVWYRRLFVIFSRYAYVNTFTRMHVPPPPSPPPPLHR
ncbi:unnamed protein product [Ectocarpus sp. CCAP 1310/34]|nr:unnamed protein product [Ectocarpus sp. CCAP 1310/34]